VISFLVVLSAMQPGPGPGALGHTSNGRAHTVRQCLSLSFDWRFVLLWSRVVSVMVPLDVPDRPHNRLLASLPLAEYDRLRQYLEPVELTYRRSLYQANRPIQFVYFFETGVGSLVNTMRNGAASEIGTIGNEGIVGLPIVLGDKRAPTSVYVQVPGIGLRMKSGTFRQAMEDSTTLREILLHYTHAFFNQVAQSAACAHNHSLEQRCCRWLLMTHDRMHSDEFMLTQEFLAMMLGIRSRPGITIAAGALQRAGLVSGPIGERAPLRENDEK
jgi:CRP-like cAMP-binding protein